MPTQGLSIGTARKDADTTMNWFQNYLFPKGLVQTIMDDKATWGKAKKGDRGGILDRHPIISGINPDGSVMRNNWRIADRGGVNNYAVNNNPRLGVGISFTNIN
tara:strand:+ start:695 stop:1006 length:312 start_codon:yes stop_codon:yes gene_type:complete